MWHVCFAEDGIFSFSLALPGIYYKAYSRCVILLECVTTYFILSEFCDVYAE